MLLIVEADELWAVDGVKLVSSARTMFSAKNELMPLVQKGIGRVKSRWPESLRRVRRASTWTFSGSLGCLWESTQVHAASTPPKPSGMDSPAKARGYR